jgi:ABC-type arginine transport system permease subunit
MDEMNSLTLATSVVGSSALVSALAFLLRSWISEWLKGAIQAEYAGKLEP